MIKPTPVERNDLVINKLTTFRVYETATLKVANYMNSSDLRATRLIPSGSVRK